MKEIEGKGGGQDRVEVGALVEVGIGGGPLVGFIVTVRAQRKHSPNSFRNTTGCIGLGRE